MFFSCAAVFAGLYRFQGLPRPGITYLSKDLHKEIIVRNPKKVGYSGLRYGLNFGVFGSVASWLFSDGWG